MADAAWSRPAPRARQPKLVSRGRLRHAPISRVAAHPAAAGDFPCIETILSKIQEYTLDIVAAYSYIRTPIDR